MKAALCVALVCLGQLAAWSAESTATAYSALRVIGKRLGADSLNRVVEVKGRFGAPEPDVWKVTLEDPQARGGLREVEVQGGRVVSERTPTARSVGPRMNFNQLNLDSEGVFTVVNGEAQKAGVNFDRADYALSAPISGGAPVWHIDLLLGQNGRVGQFDVSADSGRIVRRDLHADSSRVAISNDRAYVPPPAPPRQALPPPRRYVEQRPYPDEPVYREDPAYPPAGPVYEDRYVDNYARDDRYYDDGNYDDPAPFPEKVERHFLKRGRQIKNFFTGRGWSTRP